MDFRINTEALHPCPLITGLGRGPSLLLMVLLKPLVSLCKHSQVANILHRKDKLHSMHPSEWDRRDRNTVQVTFRPSLGSKHQSFSYIKFNHDNPTHSRNPLSMSSKWSPMTSVENFSDNEWSQMQSGALFAIFCSKISVRNIHIFDYYFFFIPHISSGGALNLFGGHVPPQAPPWRRHCKDECSRMGPL